MVEGSACGYEYAFWFLLRLGLCHNHCHGYYYPTYMSTCILHTGLNNLLLRTLLLSSCSTYEVQGEYLEWLIMWYMARLSYTFGVVTMQSTTPINPVPAFTDQWRYISLGRLPCCLLSCDTLLRCRYNVKYQGAFLPKKTKPLKRTCQCYVILRPTIMWWWRAQLVYSCDISLEV